MKAGASPRVYGSGLIALDVVFGSETNGTPRLWAGGTCGNVLVILSFLGWSAFPIGRLNSDNAAKHVKEDLLKWRVNCDFLESKPATETPVIVQRIKREADGSVSHRFSLTCPDCGAWLPTYRPILIRSAHEIVGKISKPKVFFMDRLSPGTLILAKACSQKGALIVFEPSGNSEEKLLNEALSLAHVLKYSNERVRAIGELPRHNVPLEIETLGQGGLRYRATLPKVKVRWQEVKSISVDNLKDSAGSGDWCTAGILHKLGNRGGVGFKQSTGADLNNALKFGQALAAWNCRFEGARGGMYSVSKKQFEADVEKLMKGSKIVPLPQDARSDLADVFKQLCRSCKTTR